MRSRLRKVRITRRRRARDARSPTEAVRKWLEHRVHTVCPMTTIGQLVSVLFAKYEQTLGDEKLAAVATQVALDELLRGRTRAARRKAA